MVAPVLGLLGIGCWEYDLGTGDLWWSDALGPLVGRPVGFTPATFEDANALFSASDARPGGMAAIVAGLEDGPVESERRAVLPDGSLRWTHHRYFMATDPLTEQDRIAGIVSDIDGRKRRERSDRLLTEAGEALNRSLDIDTTLETAARLVVPEFADWFVVHLIRDDRLVAVATAHSDPAKVQWAEAIQAEYPPDMDAPVGVPKVVRTADPELVADVTDDMLVATAAGDERRLEILREVGFSSVLIVPLITTGKPFGAVTMVRTDSGERYDAESLAFAQRLALKMASAIRNAELHGELQAAWDEHRRAVETLQLGLTPDPLPAFPGVDMAAHYQIGQSLVGGDWYDAFVTDAGLLALVVGDVAGRGVEAVSAMSRTRSAVKTLLFEGRSPAESMTVLNRLACSAPTEPDFVTVCCATYDPVTRLLRWSRAGHPLPLFRHGDRSTELVHRMSNPPIGVSIDKEFAEAETGVEPDTTLVLYTDGLVERSDESIDVSMQRLRKTLEGAGHDASAIVEHLASRLAGPDQSDDVTILVARF